jgi:plasmid stabilization system protein ParE
MINRVRLKLSAVEDLAEGFAWYERQRTGLGDEFLDALRECVESITRHPRGNAVALNKVRRALVSRFPYSVFYEPMDEEIIVRAIFHNARRPARWRKRLREDGD